MLKTSCCASLLQVLWLEYLIQLLPPAREYHHLEAHQVITNSATCCPLQKWMVESGTLKCMQRCMRLSAWLAYMHVHPYMYTNLPHSLGRASTSLRKSCTPSLYKIIRHMDVHKVYYKMTLRLNRDFQYLSLVKLLSPFNFVVQGRESLLSVPQMSALRPPSYLQSTSRVRTP